MTIFWTSDTHFAHKNLVEKFKGRPQFKTIKAHDKYLKEMWNDTVKVKDHVYHLGDFGWTKNKQETLTLIRSLHGYIHLIKGNHDKHIPINIPKKFEYLGEYHELKIDKQKYILCHYPFQSWNASSHGNTIHLHGHAHVELVNHIHNRLNVCIELHNYNLLTMDDITSLLNKKNKRHGTFNTTTT